MFHLEQGVEHFIITDNLSVDNTPDILAKYENMGVATVTRQTQDTYAQGKWVTGMAQQAHALGAEWIINNDADEFWIAPGSMSLKDWFGKQRAHNCVEVRRHDFVCVTPTEDLFWRRMIWKKVLSTNPLGRPLPPKIAHRAQAGLTVAQGNHDVHGFTPKRLLESDLEILHFPLRSSEQYERKIRMGGQAYSNNQDLPEAVGSTWRKQWSELRETGRLSFIENETFSENQLMELKRAGLVTEDRRLLEALEKIYANKRINSEFSSPTQMSK